jgi:hypothetical protein
MIPRAKPGTQGATLPYRNHALEWPCGAQPVARSKRLRLKNVRWGSGRVEPSGVGARWPWGANPQYCPRIFREYSRFPALLPKEVRGKPHLCPHSTHRRHPMSPSSDNGGRPHEAWSAREWSPLGERSPGGRSPTSDGPGTSLLPNEMGAALERQLLLADGASDVKERARPSGSRRAPWVAAITVVLVAGTVLTVWHLRERKTWMGHGGGARDCPRPAPLADEAGDRTRSTIRTTRKSGGSRSGKRTTRALRPSSTKASSSSKRTRKISGASGSATRSSRPATSRRSRDRLRPSGTLSGRG